MSFRKIVSLYFWHCCLSNQECTWKLENYQGNLNIATVWAWRTGRGGSMVRALVSHQYGPASNSRLYASYMSYKVCYWLWSLLPRFFPLILHVLLPQWPKLVIKFLKSGNMYSNGKFVDVPLPALILPASHFILWKPGLIAAW